MARVRMRTVQGPAPQWWKHLRPYWKRVFWKRQRQAAKKAAKNLDA